MRGAVSKRATMSAARRQLIGDDEPRRYQNAVRATAATARTDDRHCPQAVAIPDCRTVQPCSLPVLSPRTRPRFRRPTRIDWFIVVARRRGDAVFGRTVQARIPHQLPGDLRQEVVGDL